MVAATTIRATACSRTPVESLSDVYRPRASKNDNSSSSGTETVTLLMWHSSASSSVVVVATLDLEPEHRSSYGPPSATKPHNPELSSFAVVLKSPRKSLQLHMKHLGAETTANSIEVGVLHGPVIFSVPHILATVFLSSSDFCFPLHAR